MRKLIAIALVVLFGLPFANSLLAMTGRGEAKLPACCRRNGTHHCVGMIVGETGQPDKTAHVTAQQPACPYAAAMLATANAPTAAGLPRTSFANGQDGTWSKVHACIDAGQKNVHLHAARQRGPPASV